MSESTIYLITGASRGIGFGLARTFLARPKATVIAAVRDESTAMAKLAALPAGVGSRLVTVKLDSTVEADAARAVQELQAQHGIAHLDVVVANAGISLTEGIGPVAEAKPAALRQHVEVNGIAPLLLFQAAYPLLAKSTAAAGPKFLLIGSMQGSIGGMENYPFPMYSYRVSKAMAHYLVRKIHTEHEKEGIVAWALDPGFVQTDTGNAGARFFGMDEAIVKVDDSVKFIVDQIDSATRETMSGKFPSYNGGEIVW